MQGKRLTVTYVIEGWATKAQEEQNLLIAGMRRADAASQKGARHTTTTTTRIGSALVVQIWEQFIFKKKHGKG